MSNTTTEGRGTIVIVPDGSTDWVAGTDTGIEDYKVVSIQFIPSAANDRLIVRDKSITGIEKFDSGLAPGTAPIFEPYPEPQWMMPVIDASECTFGTPASCKIIIDYI